MSGALVSLSSVIKRVEGELGRIEELGRSIEETVGDYFLHEGDRRVSSRLALQDIDLLVQTLADLKVFLNHLSNSKIEKDMVNIEPALSFTKLDRVKTALAGVEAAKQNSEEDEIIF
ncbi:hypothetical protein [Roseobacter sp. GAI101]|uniref:hypothetical protein n=1 Tax=Roseobacter sp. (strain GAI101) TaxID=391589 RepID=UPI00055E4529|nr:hypothetical protein [Roseobacter sp. GAI101]